MMRRCSRGARRRLLSNQTPQQNPHQNQTPLLNQQQMLKTMVSQVLSVQNGDDEFNIIHEYHLADVGPEWYDVSQRSLFEDLVQNYEHTATIKKYAGITRKFIMLLSSIVSGSKDNEKQVMSLVATKKEGGDDSHDWEVGIDV